MDPMTLSAILGGTSIAAQMFGQNSANETNKDISSATNAFNAAEADKQRSWSELMSNTAVTRGRLDMERAGINPILAAGSPAATPSGASASGTTATVQNVAAPLSQLGGLVTSALEARNLAKQGDKIDAETKNIKMNTLVNQKGIPESELKNDAYDLVRPFVKKVKAAAQSNARANPNSPAVTGYDPVTGKFKYKSNGVEFDSGSMKKYIKRKGHFGGSNP